MIRLLSLSMGTTESCLASPPIPSELSMSVSSLWSVATSTLTTGTSTTFILSKASASSTFIIPSAFFMFDATSVIMSVLAFAWL